MRFPAPVPHMWLPPCDRQAGYAVARCLFCGQYAWSLRDLIDHFNQRHGRVL